MYVNPVNSPAIFCPIIRVGSSIVTSRSSQGSGCVLWLQVQHSHPHSFYLKTILEACLKKKGALCLLVGLCFPNVVIKGMHHQAWRLVFLVNCAFIYRFSTIKSNAHFFLFCMWVGDACLCLCVHVCRHMRVSVHACVLRPNVENR